MPVEHMKKIKAAMQAIVKYEVILLFLFFQDIMNNRT